MLTLLGLTVILLASSSPGHAGVVNGCSQVVCFKGCASGNLFDYEVRGAGGTPIGACFGDVALQPPGTPAATVADAAVAAIDGCAPEISAFAGVFKELPLCPAGDAPVSIIGTEIDGVCTFDFALRDFLSGQVLVVPPATPPGSPPIDWGDPGFVCPNGDIGGSAIATSPVTPIPEPGFSGLLATGVLGLLGLGLQRMAS